MQRGNSATENGGKRQKETMGTNGHYEQQELSASSISDASACAIGTSKLAAQYLHSTGGLTSRLGGMELASSDMEARWSVAKWMLPWNALEGDGPKKPSVSVSEKGEPSLELELSSVSAGVSSCTDRVGRKWYGVY